MISVKAVVLDVDGVLTDGAVWWGPNGEELKRFCFADITGIPLAKKLGIRLCLISGESSPAGMKVVDRFAEKLGIADVYKGCHDKVAALNEFAKKYNINLSSICFMGDDINDLPALKIVGLSAAPATAHPCVRQQVGVVTQLGGGHGAVRELLDILVASHRETQASQEGVTL